MPPRLSYSTAQIPHLFRHKLPRPRAFSHMGFSIGFGERVDRMPTSGGIQEYKIVNEGLKDQPLLLLPNENKKPGLTAAMEEMQARMKKMQEEMNTIKQQSKISMESAKESEPLKEFPDEPIKG